MKCTKSWFLIASSVFMGLLVETSFCMDLSRDTLLGLDDRGSGFYHGHEFSLDLYGFGATRDKDGKDVTAWGPGVGANYYFTKTLGVGADSSADAFEIPYMLNASGLFRYPFEQSGFAVYGLGGVGRQWKHSPQWLGHLGIGGEYRGALGGFVGSVFVDVREEFPAETKDYTVFRFGFRIPFK
jgi:hypothetical protein